MRVFVTGASGHIGSAVVPELIHAGHEVVGLARSDEAAATVKAMGAEVHRGNLTDLDSLREAARDADAVVHLGFQHEGIAQGRFAEVAAQDVEVVDAICGELAGTGKAFLGIGLGRVEDLANHPNPRAKVTLAIHGYTERGVRTVLVAIPVVTHSERDRDGFIPQYIRIARQAGVAGYVGEGANTWPAGHTLDVARVYALAVDRAPAGSLVTGATEAGVPVRTIAEAVARHLGIEAVSMSAEQAAEHFKAFPFINIDVKMPNEATRELLGWEPAHPTLLADLDAGFYFSR
jgi:nucleoside-diphosphate-sugar epimerase